MSGYLLNQSGYTAAQHTMNAHRLTGSAFQNPSRACLGTLLPGRNVLAGRQRSYQAKTVVLPAGSIESAKIALAPRLAAQLKA